MVTGRASYIPMTAVALVGVTKVFNSVTAVADLDLEVGDGEFVALLGPTGCGKTTALRLAAGLEQPDAGRVRLADRDVTKLPPADRRVAMVFQDGALYPHLNVRENIGFPLRMESSSAGASTARVERVAQLTGVGGLMGQRPGQLSGGERQRVALARALVRQPVALLLDEPLSNVDFLARLDLRMAIIDLTRRLALGTLYVTHDQAGALGLADRILVMRRGRIEQAGPPLEVYSDPATLFVAAFLGIPQTSLLQGAVYAQPEVATVIDLGDQAIRLPWATPLGRGLARHHGARVVVAVRPDAATVTSLTSGGVAGGTLTGRVTAVQRVGAHTHAWLDIGGLSPALTPSELELVEAPAVRVPSQRVGDSLRQALGRLVPHGAPAPAPTARTSYGFYPVYDQPGTPAEVNLAGTVVVRVAVTDSTPAVGDLLSFAIDPERVFLFDGKGLRLRP